MITPSTLQYNSRPKDTGAPWRNGWFGERNLRPISDNKEVLQDRAAAHCRAQRPAQGVPTAKSGTATAWTELGTESEVHWKTEATESMQRVNSSTEGGGLPLTADAAWRLRRWRQLICTHLNQDGFTWAPSTSPSSCRKMARSKTPAQS